MDGGHEAFGVGTETARVIAGAAVGAGGYLYFTKTRGWRMVAGALTSFGGGMIGYRSIVSVTDIDAGLAAGLACTATLSYEDSFSGAGYRFRGGVAWTNNVVVYRDYGVLLQVYSRKSGTRGAGGGFDKLAVSSEGNLTLSTYNDAQTSLSTTADAFAFANNEYAVSVKMLNRPEVIADFTDFSGTLKGNTNSYSTGLNKAYSDIVPSFSTGKEYSSGQGYTKQLLFRTFKGAEMGEVLGL